MSSLPVMASSPLHVTAAPLADESRRNASAGRLPSPMRTCLHVLPDLPLYFAGAVPKEHYLVSDVRRTRRGPVDPLDATRSFPRGKTRRCLELCRLGRYIASCDGSSLSEAVSVPFPHICNNKRDCMSWALFRQKPGPHRQHTVRIRNLSASPVRAPSTP